MKSFFLKGGLFLGILGVSGSMISFILLKQSPDHIAGDLGGGTVVPVCGCQNLRGETQGDDLQEDTASADSRPLTVAGLKESTLRSQLEALPLELQDKVLSKMSERPSLLNDIDSLRVDSGGMLFYVCSALAEESIRKYEFEPRLSMAKTSVSAASVSISSPPLRHSRPGASKVLFLDFNGHVVTGTAWNVDDESSWDCRPYDTDGNELTFSDSEQEDIVEIWERVAEDYAPFDIDVTTEEPSTWNRYKGRALITPTTDKDGKSCPHDGYGGIAYRDVFGDYDYAFYSPSWVLDYDSPYAPASYVAEAASHEFGHHLDLGHDGTSSAEYYEGHVSSPISWGPIMGAGYGRNISQWSKGEYFDSSNSENDLLIISGKLSYRPDDHGDSNGQATALAVSPAGDISQSGVIETPGDPDVFSFSTEMGQITISVAPYIAASSTWGANLDILLELYTSGGALVASNNPDHEASATMTMDVSSGVYYLHVKPVGVGTPLANPPSGYTVYGSLGQYTLAGVVSADADADGIPNEWEIQYFGGFTNAIATADADGDGADNLTEYISGYNPTNSGSLFEVTSFTAPASGNSPFVLSWNPVEGRIYDVGWSDGLVISPFTVIGENLPDTQSSYTDTVERAGLQNFYRVDVRLVE